MRESKIQYNPSLSVAQNAKRNGVSEAAIRYYIKVNHLDRRFERKQNLIADCRKYLNKHPNATKAELHEKTGHSLSTIRMYWEHITKEKELTNFDNQKKQKRQLRQLNNFYATHPSCTADILREEEFHKDVLEPFCGVGSMSEVIKQNGHNVLSYDIVDRGYGLVGDFYQVDFPRRKYDVITNPPYDNVIDVVLRCLDICKEKVAVLMPLRYLSSGSRYNELYKKCPPKRVYVYQERICIAKNADFEKYNDAGANMEIYAWYIWERGFKGATELKWISNQRTVTKKKNAVPVEVVEKKPTKKKQAKEAKADEKTKKINMTIRCTDEYVYFYQNTPLSNWWVSEPAIPYDNHTFTSTESLFMYLKAKVFRDDVMAERIANAHFDDAKKLGRLIQNFSDEVWERERENAMYIAIKAKLAVDEVFRDTLLSEEYKGKIFVEASPTDKVWGIRRSISEAYQGKEWRGLNLLGRLLTELRDETLGLIEPKEREITPINPDEIKTIEPVKAVPSKNTYSTDGVMVRSILGGIIGDIAGSSREGYSKNVLSPRKILTAQSYFTDDSILTVAVADWLNNQDKTTLKDCLIKWHSRYPHAGFGKLFDRFAETGEAQDSNGNGGAMRVAPCGVLAKTIEEAVSLAEQQCIVSHTTDVAINGAKAIAAAVFIAKDGASKGKTDVEIKQDVKSYVEEHYGYNLNMTLEEIQAQSVELAKQREAFRREGIESPSYLNMSNAFLSCPMAITAFLLGKNYEEAIRYALAMMGDADTIACMAGCISAQVYGIPQQLIEDALVYLPIEMIDVLNEFEPENNFEPSGITPPVINKWTEKAETVVYGSGDEQNENGGAETIASRFNPHPRFGYAIPTIGKSIEEIQEGVNAFIEYAKNNPDMRFHVRKVGYDKAGYTVEQIAPLFSKARTVRNILLPKAIVDALD